MNPPQFLVGRKKRCDCSSTHGLVPVPIRLVPVLLSFKVLIPWVEGLNFLCFIFEERRKKWLQLRKRRRNQPRKPQKRNKTPEPFKPALSTSILLYGSARQVFYWKMGSPISLCIVSLRTAPISTSTSSSKIQLFPLARYGTLLGAPWS